VRERERVVSQCTTELPLERHVSRRSMARRQPVTVSLSLVNMQTQTNDVRFSPVWRPLLFCFPISMECPSWCAVIPIRRRYITGRLRLLRRLMDAQQFISELPCSDINVVP